MYTGRLPRGGLDGMLSGRQTKTSGSHFARSAESLGMKIRLIKHEAVPDCGSYEIRYPDGRPSRYFYFADLPGRRLRSDVADRAVAEMFARAEQRMLDLAR
jgi:hypothetical protein